MICTMDDMGGCEGSGAGSECLEYESCGEDGSGYSRSVVEELLRVFVEQEGEIVPVQWICVLRNVLTARQKIDPYLVEEKYLAERIISAMSTCISKHKDATDRYQMIADVIEIYELLAPIDKSNTLKVVEIYASILDKENDQEERSSTITKSCFRLAHRIIISLHKQQGCGREMYHTFLKRAEHSLEQITSGSFSNTAFQSLAMVNSIVCALFSNHDDYALTCNQVGWVFEVGVLGHSLGGELPEDLKVLVKVLKLSQLLLRKATCNEFWAEKANKLSLSYPKSKCTRGTCLLLIGRILVNAASFYFSLNVHCEISYLKPIVSSFMALYFSPLTTKKIKSHFLGFTFDWLTIVKKNDILFELLSPEQYWSLLSSENRNDAQFDIVFSLGFQKILLHKCTTDRDIIDKTLLNLIDYGMQESNAQTSQNVLTEGFFKLYAKDSSNENALCDLVIYQMLLIFGCLYGGSLDISEPGADIQDIAKKVNFLLKLQADNATCKKSIVELVQYNLQNTMNISVQRHEIQDHFPLLKTEQCEL
eukprot:Nk52_evm77s554 gene=Nk52_evmTU77s554